MSVTIRRAQLSDLDELTRLWKELVEFHVALDPRFALAEDAEKHWRTRLAQQIKDDNWRVLIADDMGAAVGFISGVVREMPPVVREKYEGFVEDAVVAGQARRGGIGEQLYRALCEWFQTRNVKTVGLSVAVANPAAQAFWRKMGFDDYMIRMRGGLGD